MGTPRTTRMRAASQSALISVGGLGTRKCLSLHLYIQSNTDGGNLPPVAGKRFRRIRILRTRESISIDYANSSNQRLEASARNHGSNRGSDRNNSRGDRSERRFEQCGWPWSQSEPGEPYRRMRRTGGREPQLVDHSDVSRFLSRRKHGLRRPGRPGCRRRSPRPSRARERLQGICFVHTPAPTPNRRARKPGSCSTHSQLFHRRVVPAREEIPGSGQVMMLDRGPVHVPRPADRDCAVRQRRYSLYQWWAFA